VRGRSADQRAFALFRSIAAWPAELSGNHEPLNVSHPLRKRVWLATVDWGTALAPILQGPTALACPSMSGWMKRAPRKTKGGQPHAFEARPRGAFPTP